MSWWIVGLEAAIDDFLDTGSQTSSRNGSESESYNSEKIENVDDVAADLHTRAVGTQHVVFLISVIAIVEAQYRCYVTDFNGDRFTKL